MVQAATERPVVTNNSASYGISNENLDGTTTSTEDEFIEYTNQPETTRVIKEEVVSSEIKQDEEVVTEKGLGLDKFDRLGPNVTKFDPTEYNPAKADRSAENVNTVQFGNSNALGSKMINNVQTQRGALVKKDSISFDHDFEMNFEVRLDHQGNTTNADGFGFLFMEGEKRGQDYINQGGILKDKGVANSFGYKIDIRYNPETNKMDKGGMSNRIGAAKRGYTGFVKNDNQGNSEIVGNTQGFDYINAKPQKRTETDQSMFRPEELEPIKIKYTAIDGQLSVVYGDGTGQIRQSVNAAALGVDRRKNYTFAITSEVAPYYRGGAGVAVRQDGTASITYLKKKDPILQESKDITKETRTPYNTIYRKNPNLSEGLQRVVQFGRNGIKRTTDRIWYENHQEIKRQQVENRVLQHKQDKIIEIGTGKQDVRHVKRRMETPYNTIRRENPQLAEGEVRVIQQGQNGIVEITTQIVTRNGQIVSQFDIDQTIIQNKQDKIIEYGTRKVEEKSVVKDRIIPFKVITRENPALAEGETRVIQNGIEGIERVTTTTSYINGVAQPNPRVATTTIRNKQDKIIEVGTRKVEEKSKVEERKIPFEVIKRENPDLTEGETRVIQEGIEGLERITTITKYVNGVAQPNPQVTTTTVRNKQDKIIEVGTRKVEVIESVKYEQIPFKVIYVDDSSRPFGTNVVQTEGENGIIKVVTETTYINGVAQPNPKVTRTPIKSPVNKVVLRGRGEDVTSLARNASMFSAPKPVRSNATSTNRFVNSRRPFSSFFSRFFR
ncbi:G5 domain-containing protein [Aerococcus urinaehominis]|uniref:G5 domain-containing protein n=1 Tax=Aerococcus urinaehominis TaxID=128944 RepID=UPI00130E4A33|nr:G5 domain-containing protein [Aerococcus urinaehominis]